MSKFTSRRQTLQALSASALLALPACARGRSQQPQKTPQGNPEANPGDETYDQETVLGAARETFGDGAEGLATMVERVFADNGRPNAYITGEEAGGGFIGALRYGGGTLYHKIEGERPVHWTGPSLGLEIGGNAAKSFMLVYDLYDTEDLYARYPAVEGQGYFVGGLGMNYQQRDDVKIANIRLGVGYRFTANVGYLKFTKESTINPF